MQMDQPPISLVQFYDHGTKFNQVLKVSCVHVRHGVHSLHFPHNTEYSLAIFICSKSMVHHKNSLYRQDRDSALQPGIYCYLLWIQVPTLVVNIVETI